MNHRSAFLLRLMPAALMLALLIAVSGPARAMATPATDLIDKLNSAFLQAMQNGPALGYDGRYKELEPAVSDAFDFQLMARIAVGRHWQELSDQQKTLLVETFRRYSVATYAARFKAFANERFEILGEEPKAQNTVLVKNQIVEGKSGDPIRIDYLLRPDQSQGALKIVDIYLKGSISQLAVYRSEFVDVIEAKGFDGLIAKLDERIAELAKDGATQP
jgi:phospholipid transport system substrate-binding protein